MKLGILQHEVLRWRLAGAAVWQLAMLWLAAMAWTTLRAGLGAWWLSPAAWLLVPVRPVTYSTLIGLAVTMLPAFAAQAAVISTAEPPPRYFPQLAWQRAAAASVLLQRLLARAWSPSLAVGAARLGAYLALHALSALLFLSLDAALHGGAGLGEWLVCGCERAWCTRRVQARARAGLELQRQQWQRACLQRATAGPAASAHSAILRPWSCRPCLGTALQHLAGTCTAGAHTLLVSAPLCCAAVHGPP